MEQRKKFKAEISNSYVDSIFTKRRKPKQQISNVDATKVVVSIPSAMLAREQIKPNNATRPQICKKSQPITREQVFKVERADIKKQIDNQQSWSRGARSLTTALKPREEMITDGDGLNVNKKLSRDSLATFLRSASKIANENESKKRKRRPD